MVASIQRKSKEKQYMLNTILFSSLYNSSDVPIGYFTIYTHIVPLIALYAKVCTVEGQGNPDGPTSLAIQ